MYATMLKSVLYLGDVIKLMKYVTAIIWKESDT